MKKIMKKILKTIIIINTIIISFFIISWNNFDKNYDYCIEPYFINAYPYLKENEIINEKTEIYPSNWKVFIDTQLENNISDMDIIEDNFWLIQSFGIPIRINENEKKIFIEFKNIDYKNVFGVKTNNNQYYLFGTKTNNIQDSEQLAIYKYKYEFDGFFEITLDKDILFKHNHHNLSKVVENNNIFWFILDNKIISITENGEVNQFDLIYDDKEIIYYDSELFIYQNKLWFIGYFSYEDLGFDYYSYKLYSFNIETIEIENYGSPPNLRTIYPYSEHKPYILKPYIDSKERVWVSTYGWFDLLENQWYETIPSPLFIKDNSEALIGVNYKLSKGVPLFEYKNELWIDNIGSIIKFDIENERYCKITNDLYVFYEKYNDNVYVLIDNKIYSVE